VRCYVHSFLITTFLSRLGNLQTVILALFVSSGCYCLYQIFKALMKTLMILWEATALREDHHLRNYPYYSIHYLLLCAQNMTISSCLTLPVLKWFSDALSWAKAVRSWDFGWQFLVGGFLWHIFGFPARTNFFNLQALCFWGTYFEGFLRKFVFDTAALPSITHFLLLMPTQSSLGFSFS